MGLWGPIKKAINSKFTENPLDVILQNDLKSGYPLQNLFGWAGGRYPFAGATDITISSNTEWNDAVGFKKVKKLTINADKVLTITRSPFFIFADEIAGAAGAGDWPTIHASGQSSSGSTHTQGQANGGLATNTFTVAHGGGGGGILFVICKKFSGVAVTVKANGGNGGIGGADGGDTVLYGIGQGALSNYYFESASAQSYQGWSGLDPSGLLHPLGQLMANGGGVSCASGGGSGTAGGSGIGGGGGEAARTALLSPRIIYQLALAGCKGGGGGGATSAKTLAASGAGGGGGGAVVVYVNDSASVTPTLQANGGTAGGIGTAGGAGVTYLLNLSV